MPALLNDENNLNINESDTIIALAGNPNVGKSTLFNCLTGLNRHTGNWTGKTVSLAFGEYKGNDSSYIFADLPGTYSLFAKSSEEAGARDYLVSGSYKCVAVVCDASCLERNLNLVLQILEITPKVILCVNLIDEAEKKKIFVKKERLEEILSVPVCLMSAAKKEGIQEFINRIPEAMNKNESPTIVRYSEQTEYLISEIIKKLENVTLDINKRFLALRILDSDNQLQELLKEKIGENIDFEDLESLKPCEKCPCCKSLQDEITETVVKKAEEISKECITYGNEKYYERDRKIDKILTHKIWGVPFMALIFLIVFLITISGANVPSSLLQKGFSELGNILKSLLTDINAPTALTGVLIDGIYTVLTWVIAVMLPPMAIFFPLFTILEDSGYLPRMAFNLDKFFRKSGACGKQALTMAMGLGCNAAGVTGCRIIDSPREKLIAILTNVFVPCNGKYPTLIAIISMFFLRSTQSGGILGAVILTLIIISGVLITFIVSKILSHTILKGEASAFTLELPSYRKPKILETIIRSLFDKTIKVLLRAVVSAAPAGLIIWIMANVSIDGKTLLSAVTQILNPIGRFMGLDGNILTAFILGFPANEIVLPILLASYTVSGTITDYESLSSLGEILRNNGWTEITAVCMIIFMMCHFPCSTTCLTIKKETKSLKWTLYAFFIPLLTGIILCIAVNNIMRIFL